MEVDAALTADLVLVALHDRDLQKLLGQQTAKVCASGPARRLWLQRCKANHHSHQLRQHCASKRIQLQCASGMKGSSAQHGCCVSTQHGCCVTPVHCGQAKGVWSTAGTAGNCKGSQPATPGE